MYGKNGSVRLNEQKVLVVSEGVKTNYGIAKAEADMVDEIIIDTVTRRTSFRVNRVTEWIQANIPTLFAEAKRLQESIIANVQNGS